MQSYTEVWDFKDGQIIMVDVMVALTSDPDPEVEEDYDYVTIYFSKVIN